MGADTLTADEYAVLCTIISAHEPECARPLLMQLDALTVERPLVQDLTFRLDRSSLPSAPCPNGNLPVHALVWKTNEEPLGIIAVWTDDGYLHSAEYSWFTEEPTTYPRLDQLELQSPDAQGNYPPRIRRGEAP